MLHKRVLRWGNSFGIRLTRAELDGLGVHENDAVDVAVEPCRPDIDWDALPLFSMEKDASVRHDEIIRQGLGRYPRDR